jgi:TatD DNase family protein
MTNQRFQIDAFDFHCHVDLDPNPKNLIAQCESNRIAVLAVTTTPKAWRQNLLWTKNSNYVYAAVGLHPELVADRFNEIDLLETLISECRFVGEVGLDGSPQYSSSYEKQKQVFACALRVSQKHGGRVISIHSRRAAKDVVALLQEHVKPDNVLAILHWFSSSKSEARKAIEVGCYFSVNTSMVNSKNGQGLLEIIPRNRLLTETDSPFTKIDGRVTVPSDVNQTVLELAKFYGDTVSDLRHQLSTNAKKVFKFGGVDLV